jgi:hypothetical protein
MTVINVRLAYTPSDPPLWIATTDIDRKFYTAGTSIEVALNQLASTLEERIPTPNNPEIPVTLPKDGILVIEQGAGK